MTIEDAKNEVGDNFTDFAKHICCQCTANDWFCPSYCDLLERLSYMDFEYVLEKYAHYDGDLVKFSRYFKNSRWKKKSEKPKTTNIKEYNHEYYIRVTKPKRKHIKEIDNEQKED